MDWWNLWDWRYDQDTHEESDSMQSGRQCDFNFGYGHDVIEERALNEKSCIQVLRILIPKADTEIDELEKNLVSLRTELAFAEHKEWSGLCFNALRSKINSLNILLRSSRNTCEKDAEFQSIDREPAETIHDMLKRLLSKFFQQKDQQPSQVTILDLKSDALADSTKLCEGTKLSQLKLDTSVKEEPAETDTPTERCTSLDSSSKLQEMKTNCPKTKTADTNRMDPGQDYSRLSHSSDKEKELVMGDLDAIIGQQKAIEQDLSFTDKKVIENASFKPEEKSSETEVDKTAEVIAQASSSSSPESLTSCFGMGKSLCKTKSDMKANGNIEVNGGVMKQRYAATADYHPEENRAHDKTDGHSNAIVKYVSPDALIRSAALKEMHKRPGFNVSTSRAAITENFDMEQKLIDFKRTARKDGFIGTKVFVLNKFNSSNPWSKTVVKGRDDLQIVANTQHMALTLQTQHGKNTIKVELDVEEPVVEESKKALIVCGKSHLNLGQQLQTPSTKRKFQSLSQSVVGPNFPTTQSKMNASSVSGWKRQKSDSDDDDARLKQLISGKHLMKSAPLECRTKEHGTSLAIIQRPFLHQVEGKRAANLPVSTHAKVLSINLNVLDSHRHINHSGSVDSGSRVGALASLPCSGLNLKDAKINDVKVNELKAIAREHNMKGFSKLKKEELLEFVKKGLEDQACR